MNLGNPNASMRPIDPRKTGSDPTHTMKRQPMQKKYSAIAKPESMETGATVAESPRPTESVDHEDHKWLAVIQVLL